MSFGHNFYEKPVIRIELTYSVFTERIQEEFLKWINITRTVGGVRELTLSKDIC